MHIKKEFDRRFGTTWHCVVGKKYASRFPSCLLWGRVPFLVSFLITRLSKSDCARD